MTVLASAIISRVRTQLIDNGATPRWTDAELLQWLSDGQRTIVTANPRASAKRAIVPLVAGTRQPIPTDGFIYLDAYRNMGAGGATPGTTFVEVAKSLLDAQYPTWHAAPAVAQPFAKAFDPTDPAVFYVYPPSDGTGEIELLYAAAAAEITTTTTPLVIADVFSTPLFDYTMWRCVQKDSDYVSGQQTAAQYLAAFSAFMGAYLKDPGAEATQSGKP